MSNPVLAYTQTVDIDQRMLLAEIWQSLAHTLMLGGRSIIPTSAARAILGRLLVLHRRAQAEEWTLAPELEDVHLNVEHEVIEALGIEVGGHLHAARSRNDQVATDTRIYVREALLESIDASLDLASELLDLEPTDMTAVLPGYTHSQPAQPITVAFWKTGHASMILRDAERLRGCFERTNQSPLGACALAGTSFDLDRQLTARLLGFDRVLVHALDATSARDHLLEIAATLAIGSNTLSRMAEEIVVWSGAEYGLLEVGDAFATGSSIMPQKKNPVVAELVRARAGRGAGALVQLLTAVKGVSLGYSCDLQEDKPFLWISLDSYLDSLRLLTQQAPTLRFDHERGEALCWRNFSTATELANHLVEDRGMPFRQAHRVVGELVGELISKEATLREVGVVESLLAEKGIQIDAATLERLLAPASAVARYTSPGATSPASVARLQAELVEECDRGRNWVATRRARLQGAWATCRQLAEEICAGAEFENTIGAAQGGLVASRHAKELSAS